MNKIKLQFIEPGKPKQNALDESFNCKFRDEVFYHQHQMEVISHEHKMAQNHWIQLD